MTEAPSKNRNGEAELRPEAPFAELCAKSAFSLLEGASRPEELVERAHALGLRALGVADRNGPYGSARVHVAARGLAAPGLQVIVGVELLTEVGAKVVLLVQSHAGYANLCRLLTRAHAGRPRDQAVATLDDLAACAAGLVALAPVKTPAPDEEDLGEARLVALLHEVWKERAFLASWRHLALDDRAREGRVRALSARHGMDVVATARPLYHDPSRKPVADVLQCIREKTTLDRAGVRLGPNAEAYLRSPADMARLFRDAPERVARTVEIAAACPFSLGELRYAFPSDDLFPGETPDAALRRLVGERLPVRYPEGPPREVRVQIEKELALIAKLGVAQFFLSVHEIVEIARQKRILCQGRGSAANSAVCYVLGITAVDPARSSLLFERFLSEERNEPPDIDVDFEHERREEVIQAIYEKYGRGRAAMVSEVICFRGKSALRETAKAFGLSLEQADRLSGTVGHWDAVSVNEERLREAGLDPSDARLGHVLRVAGELQGLPRHLATHVGGFVLSARPLEEIAPVEPARMPGRTVVPWDKDDIDALGFFKVDVLGLGMLTCIRKALALVFGPRPGREVPPFDPIEALASIPPEDPDVYASISRADTVGVFQIESRAQMAMLPRLRPRNFYDLVIEVAIVRPGPIQGGMVHPYLRRRSGEEPVTSPHPSLAPILARTLGVPLFQEQVMQIAIVGAGYTGGEADGLRRDMAAWRRDGRLARHRDKLLAGFAAHGISAAFGERLYAQIQGFGEYGFPESHAASFALLVYASAWLKHHHAAAFACALLNAQPMGFYSASSIVRDAQKHGVEIRPVDVTRSDWDNTLEDGAIRLGMRQVRGLGEDVAARVVAARTAAPPRDVEDLAHRARLRPDQVEILAEAGALAPLVPARRDAIWRARAPSFGPLFAGRAAEEPAPRLPRMSAAVQLSLDYGRTGISIDDHPLRHLRPGLDARRAVRADDLAKLRHGTPVAVAGMVLSRQRPATASGVTFFSIEDETGTVNLIVLPDVFSAHDHVARHARLLLARGTLERTPRDPRDPATPVIHVLVRTLERLDGKRPIAARSRDFH